ncbi:MAG: EamA family transporter [Hyphomicrobiaceae bacterium]
MTTTADDEVARQSGLNGWVEAGLFSLALAVLNVSYALGHQIGAHPVAFLVYAMNIAALTLLVFTGPGPHWREIVRHPLSFVVGGGIIAMEAVYYMLLKFVTPADGSMLVRTNVPVAALLAAVLLGRRPPPLGVLGILIVTGGIAWYVPGMSEATRWIGVALGLACGTIMSLRAFATEFHPWNRKAHAILDKMRVTGLVLLVSSTLATSLVAGLMALVAADRIAKPGWLPGPEHFAHWPTFVLALFMGALVLTAMQYLQFSVVVKIRAENFMATTAFIPLVTILVQSVAVALGILSPLPFVWSMLAPMGVVIAGVLIAIWAGRRGLPGKS